MSTGIIRSCGDCKVWSPAIEQFYIEVKHGITIHRCIGFDNSTELDYVPPTCPRLNPVRLTHLPHIL